MPRGVNLDLSLHDGKSATAEAVPISDLVIAGWTGRDRDAVEKHIRELEAIGVKRPSTVPCYYRVAAARLTTAEEIEATGGESSGEVEFVLYGHPKGMLIGVGSDHTDRKIETISVAVSKQMCDKPVSKDVWYFADVAKHWDELRLRSWAVRNGARKLYQEGSVTAMRTPAELIAGYTGGGKLPVGTAMFCGTLAAHGGVAAADRFELELEDPVLKRRIRHAYAVKILPTVA
jgi:biotin operon repressor